jgi:hypothetical protein
MKEVSIFVMKPSAIGGAGLGRHFLWVVLLIRPFRLWYVLLMSVSENLYWNLAQASAWIAFRDEVTVQNFVAAPPQDWKSFLAYPSLWPLEMDHPNYSIVKDPIDENDDVRQRQRADIYQQMQAEVFERISGLRTALISDQLTAYGRPAETLGALRPISSTEWNSLTIAPPGVYTFLNGKRVEPWLDVVLKQKAVLAIWPQSGGMVLPKKKRNQKDWEAVDRCLQRLRKSGTVDLSSSDRYLAERILRMLRNELEASEIPSDRALRNHISELRKSGQLPRRKSG